MAESTDRRVLVLSPEDNVCVACVYLKKGEKVTIDGATVTLQADVPIGHKMARRPLAAGTKVVKWAAPIGSMVEAVPLGGLVHVHNMKSDYIPTFTRDKGFIGEGAS